MSYFCTFLGNKHEWIEVIFDENRPSSATWSQCSWRVLAITTYVEIKLAAGLVVKLIDKTVGIQREASQPRARAATAGLRYCSNVVPVRFNRTKDW